jgi:phosphoglycerate dehydrogenase-like enzyme
MTITVLVRYGLEGVEEEFRQRMPPRVEVRFGEDGALPDAEVVFGRVHPPELATARRLRWVQLHSTGADSMDYPAFRDRGIALTALGGALSGTCADHALGLLLAMTRNLPRLLESQRAKRWEVLGPVELDGLTAGIIGLGNIGRQVARRLVGFGMRVRAVDAAPVERTPEVDRLDGMDALPSLLQESRAVFVCCPLTPATHHLIDAAALARMRRDAFLVHISRGGVVDDAALDAALRGGVIAGAGVDVTEEEPLPPGHPLWTSPNLILTPHNAGYTQHLARRRMERLLDNLSRYADGRPLSGLIDLTRPG